MVRRIDVTGREGIRLAAWEFADPPKGGHEPDGEHRAEHGPADPASGGPRKPHGVLLLHGLMGRAAHWADTARWLSSRYHAIGLDQRGHGRSDKPEDAGYDRSRTSPTPRPPSSSSTSPRSPSSATPWAP